MTFKTDEKGRIIYYGNFAGYIQENKVIIDRMFKSDELKSEISHHLKKEIEWKDGVYDRLANGEEVEKGIFLKSLRIHQLKPEVDPLMKFIAYDKKIKKFGEMDRNHYKIVYDGEIESNNLEVIFSKFNLDHPQGYKGHSLSISDIIELYDKDGSEYYYVDTIGFKQIRFEEPEQSQSMHIL